MEWTQKDAQEASKEGWNIFECNGSANGKYQLQVDDELALLNEDKDAWKLVARQEKDIHKKALAFLKEKNYPEYKLIIAQT